MKKIANILYIVIPVIIGLLFLYQNVRFLKRDVLPSKQINTLWKTDEDDLFIYVDENNVAKLLINGDCPILMIMEISGVESCIVCFDNSENMLKKKCIEYWKIINNNRKNLFVRIKTSDHFVIDSEKHFIRVDDISNYNNILVLFGDVVQ